MDLDDFFKVCEAQWKGGTEPTAFPHVCPYRPDGIEKAACIELSGSNLNTNGGGCCGTHRGATAFPPCNSAGRRCVACLQMGRRGARASPVADITTGRCAEHRVEHPVAQRARAPRPVVRSVLQPAARMPPATLAAVPVEPKPAPADVCDTAPPRDKKLRGMGPRGERNLAAIKAAAAELRQAEARVTPAAIFDLAAGRIGITPKGLSAFFYLYVTDEETRSRLLYGDLPAESRSQEILRVCLAVCEERRAAGKPIGSKKELAQAAAARLAMTVATLQNHLSDTLRHEDAVKLGFVPRCDLQQQTAVIRNARAAMRDRGAPPPRQADLAKAVAPLLGVTSESARSLIASLPADIRQELKLAGYAAKALHSQDPQTLRRAFLGAFDVLALRKEPATAARIGVLLRINADAVTLYLDENPSLGKLAR